MGEDTRYPEELRTIRTRVDSTAAEDVTHLYKILTEEDKREPIEARKILEHDLGDLYSKRTILAYLPKECKEVDKVKAGKEGAKATNLVLAEGQSVTTEADAGIAADDAKLGDEDLNKAPDMGFIPEGIDDSKVDYWKPSEERQDVSETDIGKLQQSVNLMQQQLQATTGKLEAAMTLVEKKEKKNIELDDANIKLRAQLKAHADGMPWHERKSIDVPDNWRIGGGPIPDMEDDWYKPSTTLGEVLGHLRYLKASRKEKVTARIIVIPQK